ncbi:hypothetical protein TREES_T100004718 [Tupaia chinensis]|uniref:LTD domain-containing protein n=1 Tax=Tupaia chinensis TaxID=246437 RepID=L8YCC3_TUPCH|nr:hypothetical protein TREES_T100004718 [Tupaia chinensis]
MASTCPQNTKPHSTRMGVSTNTRLAPESLDPHTLRLLWGQRELEIQALRWAVQNGQDARHCHILQEVAGLLPERSSRNQEKFLQSQIQKLTLELKEQKEQAQLEKQHLEEQLRLTTSTLQQLQAELQTFQKSCLLQLARSSWVGRVLRSQTGSVEVVTAETLMDSCELSESDQTPVGGEGFRLEDVDWNSIAHRYPNLFTSIHSNSDQKQTRRWPSLPLDASSSESHRDRVTGRLKSVEWSSLTWVGTSRSGSTDSDSSSCQLALSSLVQVTGDPPQQPDHASSEQIQTLKNFSGDSEPEGFQKTSDWPGETALEPEPRADLAHHCPDPWPRPTSYSLKIVAVSCRGKFVRVFNQSLEDTADLSDFMLQQLVRDFPVCMYRFPPGTLLAPRHHITVWGEGTSRTRKEPSLSLGREPVHFRSSRGCVTLLLNPKGEVLSQHQAPHSVTPVSRIFVNNTDLSIDCFPLSEAQPDTDAGNTGDTGQQKRRPRPPCKGRVQEARAKLRKPGTRGTLPLLGTSKPCHPREVPARPERAETKAPELLPTISGEGAQEAEGQEGSLLRGRRQPDPSPIMSHAETEAESRLQDCRARKEHKVRASGLCRF